VWVAAPEPPGARGFWRVAEGGRILDRVGGDRHAVAVMLGGTLPIPLYVLYEPKMVFGPLGITVVFAVFEVIATIVDKNSIDINGKPPTSSQLLTAVIFLIVSYAIYALLWVLMARFNRAGMKWARIVATVLFAISTFQLYETIDSLHGGQVITAADIIYIIITLASWAVGVGAIAMLWRSDSSAYFQAQTIRRR